MSVVYANCPDLVTKHKKHLDMINWADIDPLVELTREVACSINKGVCVCVCVLFSLRLQIVVFPYSELSQLRIVLLMTS